MKRIILILLLFSNYLTAQQWQPTSIRQRFVNGIGIPTRDTLPGALSDSSQLVLRPQDSVIYFKYKRYWRALGGQPQLNGTGFVKASGTTISYDNSSYYLASNPNGYTSNLGTVTSVSGTGTVSGLTLSGTVTSSGNLTLGGALSLTSGQVTTALGFTPYNSTNPAGYITSASLSGYLPLTGGTLASSGSTNTLNINHSSGSGIALNISKNGNGEGLTIVKGSGSGNAASITGGITLLSELNLTTKLADAHINSAATWNAKIGGSGTTNYLAKFTASGTLGNSALQEVNGNLGLGVTPSAWDGTLVKAIQLADNGASLSSFSTGNTSGKFAILSNNAYYDTGGWKYLQSASSAQYRIANQEHQWFAAPSGTAGNAISFTQAMTLDASGRLGIGTTSPSSKLHTYLADGANDNILKIQNGSNAYASGISIIANNDGGAIYNFINSQTNGGTEHWRISGGATASTMAISTGGTERLRITSSGNVGIGTSTPSYQLDLGGGTTINQRLRLQRGSDDNNQNGLYGWNSITVERNNVNITDAQTDFSIIQKAGNGSRTPFYISSSGNVGIGTTSPAEKLSVAGRLLVNTNTTDGANALQVNGSAKISSLAGTGERLVAADANGKLVVSANITSGYYTPTITLINGIASATASPLMYTNINGIVTVTGKITINSNILTEVNELEINLPASNPNVSPNSVGGCGVEVTASAFRTQDVLNFNSAFNYAKIAITFKSNATGSKVYTFSFSYDSNYFP